MTKIIQITSAVALALGLLAAGPGVAQAGFLGDLVGGLTAPEAIISDPSDNPEAQAEIDYLGRDSQAEADYLGRDAQSEIDYLGQDAQAEIDYYNSFSH